MSGIVGTANTRSEIAITFQGVTDWFPTPENPEEQEFGGGDIQTSTLESFSPSVVAGDPTVISNDILAAMTWSNFQDGMGTLQYAPQEGTGSLDSFRTGSLDTRFPNMALLPPRRIGLGTLAATYSAQAQARFAPTGNATYPLICYSLSGTTPASSLQRMDASNVWTTVSFPGMPAGGDSVFYLPYNGYHVFATQAHGIVTSTDLVTFTQRWNPGYCTGLCVHDNKLYTYAAGKVCWTLDPTAASWPFQSTDALQVEPGETVNGLVEWKNRQASRSLFLFTSKRIVAYDDDDYFAEFFSYGKYINGAGSDMTVWLQDKGLYFAPGDNGANVLAFQNQTISNISPMKKGGFPQGANFAIARLQGGLNWLFAQTTGPSQVGAIGIDAGSAGGSVFAATSYGGDIIAYNGRGWHTIIQGVGYVGLPASPRNVTSMSYFKDQLVYRVGKNVVETVYVPDSAAPPLYADGPVSWDVGSFVIVSGRTDAALKGVQKTGRFWEVMIEKPDGTPGLPPNCTANLSWTPVGYSTTSFPQMDSTTVFPARFACSNFTDAGVPWQAMNWQLNVTKSGTAWTDTPVLRSVTLYYLRSPNLIDGYQFRIDLSERRFQALGNGWRGRDRLYLYNRLMAIKAAKTNVAIQYGTEGDPVVIPAAEVRIAGQLNGGTGSGLFTVTARDVSTPANG